MTSVLSIVYDNFWKAIVERLIKKGVNIKYVILPSKIKKDFEIEKHTFKNTIFLSLDQFVFPEQINKLNSNNRMCLSSAFLKNFCECENLFLSISDRLSFFPLSVQKRKELFQDLLLFWFKLLSESDLKTIIFDTTPHMAWDNILYYLAKYLGIKTLFVEKTMISDRVMLLQDYLQLGIKIPNDYLSKTSVDDIKEIIGKELIEEAFKTSIWTKFADNKNINVMSIHNEDTRTKTIDKLINKYYQFNFIVFSLKLFEYIKNRFYVMINNTFIIFKKRFLSSLFFNGQYRWITTWIFFLQFKQNVKKLYKFYIKSCSDVNYSHPYVFFPLHYQPEKNTSPLGGIFENQFLAAKILSEAIPEDWILYIKEHPRQFSYAMRQKHYRDPCYYKKLLSLPKVKLVNVQEDAEALIDNAMCTATITGSSGWKSLKKGKACIAFGNPWYAACNSCFLVRSLEECKKAITNIVQLKELDIRKDLLRFIAYYKDKFIISSTGHNFAKKSKIPYETLVENLAEKFTEQIFD